MKIEFAEVSDSDSLPAETRGMSNGREVLAVCLRHLCPSLTHEEARALSLVPPDGDSVPNVASLRALVERELPRLRGGAP